jgi:hypothetical protein
MPTCSSPPLFRGPSAPPFRGPSAAVSKRPPGILVFAQLGMIGAVCLLAGGALGWFVDHEVGTLPLFLFCGLLVGAALGGLSTWREVKKHM